MGLQPFNPRMFCVYVFPCISVFVLYKFSYTCHSELYKLVIHFENTGCAIECCVSNITQCLKFPNWGYLPSIKNPTDGHYIK